MATTTKITRPKGHKRGCQCVICARKTRKNHGYENQAHTLHARRARHAKKNSTVILPGTVRSRSAENELSMHRRRRGNPSETDRELAEELVLYAENTGELYPLIVSTRKTLMTRKARGDFDFLKAGKAWMGVANRAAQMYTKEMQVPGPHGSYGMFSPAARSKAAGRMMSHFSTGAAAGDYDYLLPKKYQRKNPAHFPRTKAGPKGTARWYILDLFDGRGNLVSSRYRKCARAKCATEAAGLVDRKVGKKMVRKVELSGPYARKPTASTARK